MKTSSSISSTASATGSPLTAVSSDQEGKALLNTIYSLLSSKLRLTMTDGRIVQGKFICLDRLGNIILDSAVEYRQIVFVPPPSVALSSEDRENCNCSDKNFNENPRCTKFMWNTDRSLSQAVIQGNRLARVEIAKSDWEKRLGNAP